MKKLLFITLIGFFSYVGASKYVEETTWYCAPEKSAGLKYNNITKEYEVTKFKQEKLMLVESKSTFENLKEGEENWHWLKIKKKPEEQKQWSKFIYHMDECKEYLGIVECHSFPTKTFALNIHTGKATASNSFGWLSGFHDVPHSDANVELYSCEKF